MSKYILGIDVGATGTKAAMVDIDAGELVTEKIKLKTPESKKPEDMAAVICELVDRFEQRGNPIGIGFPAVIRNGVALTASNIHKQWIGMPINTFLEEKTQGQIYVINDADAAGISEMTYGVGKDKNGTVILLTLGTGIGSAIFKDGLLLRNTELGHLRYNDNIAEYFVSNTARKRDKMDWPEYSKALNSYLEYVHKIFYPDLLILGGGISKRFELFKEHFGSHIQVVPAQKFNNAGIIGAALAWRKYYSKA
ncbi:MAG: ROK family protein [Saprospiraceae bacterium]|nr:ROK family protein [Saprospiraceae bacterium]